MASAGGERLSAAEFRKKKEIEEARKSGQLPPEQDEQGNMINPHNPEYISKRPWYLGDSGPSLKHQGIQKADHLLSITEADQLYRRGRKKAVTKYRKGACKNCGAMTHKERDCVERPRKIGAWKTNKDIQADEVFVDVRSQKFGKLAFDAKRDQWLGYNPDEHKETIQRYEEVDEKRMKYKVDSMNKEFEDDHSNSRKKKKKQNEMSGSDSDSDYESEGDSEDEEFIDKDGGRVISKRVARQGGVGGAQMKTTVRNLRIREDTAKYLRNLNPNSAYYDPKTRSMRQNPNPELNPDDLPFAGDNFIRHTGDASKLAQTQLFAWEAYEKGTDIHPIATPSQAEFMKKEFEEKKQKLKEMKQKSILEKYGNTTNQHTVPSKELLFSQTEEYVEYDHDGRVIKGQERSKAKSKYIEDVLENNHTSIWGSWYDRANGGWGFACCHSKVRKSYCTGEAGKKASESSMQKHLLSGKEVTERSMLKPTSDTTQETSMKPSSMQLYGENLEPEIDKKKLKKALKKEAAFHNKEPEIDDRKRKYNSMSNYEVTAEEMEAYHMQKRKTEDPMANFIGKNKV